MNVEGRVTVDVKLGEVPAVHVSFTQPGDVARILRGKSPTEALAIVPVLYSLCGKAQSYAARLALDAAERRTRTSEGLAAMQCLTEMETLRENTLRIALDWTRLLGEGFSPNGLKPLMRLVPELEATLRPRGDAHERAADVDVAHDGALRIVDDAEDLLANLVFGESLEHWQARRLSHVLDWAAQGRTPAGRLLHHIHSRGMADAGAIVLHKLAALDGDAILGWFAEGTGEALPFDCGMTAPEATLLARHADDRRLARASGNGRLEHGLLDRLMARLIELAGLPTRMRDLLCGRLAPRTGRTLSDTIGMGEVAAARGTLVHVAAVEGQRITRYRVLSPTRWNFDAGGVAARTVERIAKEHRDDAQLLAELMVNTIDPCVACNVRVH